MHGSIGVHMTQTLPEEYTSVLQAEGVDDNALVNIKGGAGGGGGGVGLGGVTSGGSGSGGNAAKLPKLQSALGAKLYLVVW